MIDEANNALENILDATMKLSGPRDSSDGELLELRSALGRLPDEEKADIRYSEALALLNVCSLREPGKTRRLIRQVRLYHQKFGNPAAIHLFQRSLLTVSGGMNVKIEGYRFHPDKLAEHDGHTLEQVSAHIRTMRYNQVNLAIEVSRLQEIIANLSPDERNSPMYMEVQILLSALGNAPQQIVQEHRRRLRFTYRKMNR